MAIDPDGAVTTYRYDGLGRLVEREHPDAGITHYTYDKAGNLTETRTQRQHLYNDVTTYTYDYNRQTSMLHRLSQDSVTIEYGQPGTHSAGLPVRVISHTGVELMEYDELGNVSALTQFVTLPREEDAVAFRTEWHYDSWNRLLDMTYSDRETVSYTYNPAGQLMKMAGDAIYIDNIQYDIFGNRVQIDYGNGTTQNYQYDNMLRLTNTQLNSAVEGKMKDLSYTYDAVGNILSQNNQQKILSNGLGGVYLQSYNYDAMNRLTGSSGGNNDVGVSYNLAQSYSPSGRIGGKTCDFTSQNDVFYYDASGYQMHALRKTIDIATGSVCDFAYDENGNMQGYVVDKGKYVSYNIWNAANQMAATGNTRACGYYGYGSDGKRRYKLTGKTSVMSTNARNVVMDFSFGEYVLYPNSFLTGTAKGYTKHYYAGSERVASRVVERWFVNAKADSLHSVEEHHIKDALQMSNWQFDFTLGERPSYMNSYMPDSVSDIMGNTIQNKVRFPVLALAGYFKAERLVGESCEDLSRREGANGLFFTHSDHLGSSSWTTDADGRAVQHIEYLPFGEELLNQRATSYSERYTFTGKELDEESNLYYYDARYNSSTYSQFNSVDPMSDKYPSVNPYLYCAGNPIKYVDPTGEVIDYTSYLPYSAQVAYTSCTDYLCEESHPFRTLLTKLEASTTTLSINIGQTVLRSKDNPDWGTVDGQYVKNKNSVEFTGESTLDPLNSSVIAEELFHAYQQDNLDLYDGKEVNFEFEAKVFANLVTSEAGGAGFTEPVRKVADAILNKEMDINSKEFENLYMEQCNIFIQEQKKSGVTNKHYIAPNNSLPKSLMSIINSQDK